MSKVVAKGVFSRLAEDRARIVTNKVNEAKKAIDLDERYLSLLDRISKIEQLRREVRNTEELFKEAYHEFAGEPFSAWCEITKDNTLYYVLNKARQEAEDSTPSLPSREEVAAIVELAPAMSFRDTLKYVKTFITDGRD